MKVGSLVLVLLHEDILACNSRAGGTLVESTVISMKSMAERFFCQTGLIAVSGMGTKGCKEAKEKILKASSRSHFQWVFAFVFLRVWNDSLTMVLLKAHHGTFKSIRSSRGLRRRFEVRLPGVGRVRWTTRMSYGQNIGRLARFYLILGMNSPFLVPITR